LVIVCYFILINFGRSKNEKLDDYGYFKAITYGILDSYKTRIFTSITMQMNTATEHDIEAAKENPSLEIGVYLESCC
jgi:predicted glycoside hydrolase/deacetylase ChbG (UPF0249 family)